MKHFRPTFKRDDEFVVVKRIRLTSSEVLMPGEKVSRKDYGLHRLMHWWKRRSIAKADCSWANSQIEAKAPKKEKVTPKPSKPRKQKPKKAESKDS